MTSCIRCREDLSMPTANYCGNCSFPILNEANEEEVRERARDEVDGFLEGFDVKTIHDTKNGDQKPPETPYQWYLEEAVMKAFIDFVILQQWDWFDKGSISELFFKAELFDDEPSEEATNNYLLWARVSAFIYEAFQPAGVELSICLGALLIEDVDSHEDIDVEISVRDDDESESDVSGPAS